MKAKEIDYEEMNRLLYYDETSPSYLRWKLGRRGVVKDGVAGSILTDPRTGNQCWQVKISSKIYYAHRVIYVLHHHQLQCELQIDHIDGNALHNKISNLRAVINQTNSRNRKQYKNNTTGVTGVFYDAARDRYCAQYYDQQGRLKKKRFPCKKLGADKAFELACSWRAKMIGNINTMSGSDGYTDRHGKPK